MPPEAPALSIVLAAPRGLAHIGATLAHLRAQTARPRLEVVIVTDVPEPAADVEASLGSFAAHRVVRVDKLASRAAANAEGCRHAAAGIVAFAEDHCFPEPAWAEALLRRHAERWAAVGPEIGNANPESALSWCDFLLNYGPWMAPATAGPASHLPGHNTSYKLPVLERYGDDLAAWLEVETELHRDMESRGEGLYLEPEAKISHINVSRWSAWLPSLFHGGRIYAAARSRYWPLARRFLYAAAWPLIALVRMARLLSGWPEAAPPPLRLAAILLVGLAVDAVGQAAGYVAGAGRAAERMARFEFDRIDHVRAADRAGLEGLLGA
jgi:GT2 family glycosyltransferase